MIEYRIYEQLLNRTNIVINQSITVDNATALKGLELLYDIVSNICVDGCNVVLKDGEYHVNKSGVF